jgi:hypothetical protein
MKNSDKNRESPYNIALDKALTWVRKEFKPIGIIVSGSIIRGNPDINSDFDIYVIHQDSFRQRIQKYFEGIPCEIFVNNLNHIYGYLEQEYKSNRPVTAHIISTGKVIEGAENLELQKLIQSSKEFLSKSPTLTESQRVFIRYAIATMFEDATDLKDTDTHTSTYFLNKLVNDIIDYTFRNNSIPLPRPKERIKYLEINYPDIGKPISDFFSAENFFNKYEIAKKLVKKTVGEIGFFEWDSGRD